MSTDKIIDRVRKMLALANDAGASQGERDNALRMVSNLLAKHNLDMVDVANAGGPDTEPREQQVGVFNGYPWARGVAHTIARLFFCEYYFMRPVRGTKAEHYFVGRQSNAITANEMAAYIVNNIFRELRARYTSVTAPEARCFAEGVATTLRTRVAQIKAAQAAEAKQAGTGRELVLASLYDTEAKANNAWIGANVTGLKVQPDRSKAAGGAAYHAGKEHGKTIGLNNQIGTASNSRTLRLK